MVFGTPTSVTERVCANGNDHGVIPPTGAVRFLRTNSIRERVGVINP